MYMKYSCLLVYVIGLCQIWLGYQVWQDDFKNLPKIELHSHLHGSIRRSTLFELAREKRLTVNMDEFEFANKSSSEVVHKAFDLFRMIHEVVTNITVVKRIFDETIVDYMAENTIYLEIRSTPRSLSDGTTIQSYMESLLAWIQKHNNEQGHKMMVKLIVSLDRSKTVEEAKNVTNLATRLFVEQKGRRDLVGLDYSGNPLVGKFKDFEECFILARSVGMRITVHTAETPALSESKHSDEQDDTSSILSFR